MHQKDFGVIQKVCSLKTSNFQPFSPCSSLFILHAGCLWIFEWKTEDWKGRKELFFGKLNIKDDIGFTQIYIYDNNNKNIFTCSYIREVLKNVYVFFIKLLATAKQLIRRNSTCCLKNQAIFHRVSIEKGLTPPLPLFVFIHSLRTSLHLHNKPFIKNSSLEEIEGVKDNASTFMHLNIKTNK